MEEQFTLATRQYKYDANGNLVTDSHRGIDGTAYMRGTYPDRVIQGTDASSYLYDNADLRIAKKVVTSAQTTQEMYIKDALGRDISIVTFATSGGTTTQHTEYFVYGTDRVARIFSEDEPDNRIKPVEATYFLYDHLGNTRVAFKVDDNDVPEISNAMDYYSYGKILREYHNGPGDRYLTTQHERDKETGLDYRGARYYDSDVARFLSTDPWMGMASDWSPYRYCFDNPINFIDPDGLFETRQDAKDYKKENGIKGRVRKDSEGGFVINSKSLGVSYKMGNDFEQSNGYTNDRGVVESILVTKNHSNSRSQSDQMGFDGINHIWAPLLIASGEKITALKPIGVFGSSKGSSIASTTLSKVLPMRSPVIKTVTRAIPAVIRGGAPTAVLGRAAGRFVPVLGWGLLTYDVVSFGYNNRKEITQGLQDRQRYIDEGLMPLR